MDPFATIMITAGLICLAIAIFNPALFYEHPSAAVLVDVLGRVGTRIFYLLVGLGLLYYGYVPL